MPQVIACNEPDSNSNSDSDFESPELPPDFPPESIWLSGEAGIEWFDRNALFERKDSTKGSVSNNYYSGNLNPSSEPSSQRFIRNLNSQASNSIIGLPRLQKPPHRRACRPVMTTRLFNKRSGSGNEPGSPKVSCMGRVRSKRDRTRRSRKWKPEQPERAGKGKTGLFGTLRAMFRGKGWAREVHAPPEEVDDRDIRNRLSGSEVHAPSMRSVAGSEPPGLGAVKRFASGRRSGSWG